MAQSEKNNAEYNNQSISMLKGADRVRKRPAVIFGSDGLEGCEHSFFEILSNSVDEAREGHGNEIIVTVWRDHTLQVDQNDVVSLHTHGNLVCCRLTDGEYSWRESLSAVLERLEQRLFVRVSRSCAVNMRHIQTMDWGESLLTMDDGRIHPVSRRMKSALRAAISS